MFKIKSAIGEPTFDICEESNIKVDYIIEKESENGIHVEYCIECKTFDDFKRSITDGRMKKQIEHMVKTKAPFRILWLRGPFSMEVYMFCLTYKLAFMCNDNCSLEEFIRNIVGSVPITKKTIRAPRKKKELRVHNAEDLEKAKLFMYSLVEREDEKLLEFGSIMDHWNTPLCNEVIGLTPIHYEVYKKVFDTKDSTLTMASRMFKFITSCETEWDGKTVKETLVCDFLHDINSLSYIDVYKKYNIKKASEQHLLALTCRKESEAAVAESAFDVDNDI